LVEIVGQRAHIPSVFSSFLNSSCRFLARASASA
jgi:hypothetical protein